MRYKPLELRKFFRVLFIAVLLYKYSIHTTTLNFMETLRFSKGEKITKTFILQKIGNILTLKNKSCPGK